LFSIASWNYDRVSPIADGRIKPLGIEDVRVIHTDILESVEGMLSGKYDAGEFSLSIYIVTLFREKLPFIAIPVFTSRMFRHRSVFVRNESRIQHPSDLAGKKVGVPRFRQTAGVWIRGILSEDYGLPVSSVEYFQGAIDNAGEPSESEMFGVPQSEIVPSTSIPGVIRLRFIEKNKTLSQMLLDGEIDAIYSAEDPRAFVQNKARRLFADYVREEKEYFRKTRVFPIMHLLVIKRNVYDNNPQIARDLYDAFLRAKEVAMRDMNQSWAHTTMLPWQEKHVTETRDIMGNDYWPYGIKANRKTLETFLKYSYDQGLAKRLLSPEEIFANEMEGT
jgi:4,5-dihydroxyphthalate decarboxylase